MINFEYYITVLVLIENISSHHTNTNDNYYADVWQLINYDANRATPLLLY